MINARLRAMTGDIGCAAFTGAQRCLDFVVQTVHVMGKNQISFNQVLDVANGTQHGAAVVLADATARTFHRSCKGSVRMQHGDDGGAGSTRSVKEILTSL
jgi:hypothetical protein